MTWSHGITRDFIYDEETSYYNDVDMTSVITNSSCTLSLLLSFYKWIRIIILLVSLIRFRCNRTNYDIVKIYPFGFICTLSLSLASGKVICYVTNATKRTLGTGISIFLPFCILATKLDKIAKSFICHKSHYLIFV